MPLYHKVIVLTRGWFKKGIYMRVDIHNTTNKYNIIYADPPWRYADQKGNNPKMGG